MARDAFQTGVHSLDRALGGGIPPGSVAVALGDARSAVELVGYRTAVTTTCDTRYLTTMRTPATVRAALDDAADAGQRFDTLGPAHPETVEIQAVEGTAWLDEPCPSLGQNDAIVVDSFRDIVASGDWREPFDATREHVRDREGLALLVFDVHPDASLSQPLRQLCRAADAVLEYHTDRTAEDTLTVRKMRGLVADEPVLPVTVPLEVGRTVHHDPDRGHQ